MTLAPPRVQPSAPGTPPVAMDAPPASGTAVLEKPAKKKKDPPWVTTPPLSPEQRRAKNRLKRRRNEAKFKLLRPEILAKLAEKWPVAFPADAAMLRPLAIGVHHEIIKEFAGYPQRAVSIALRKITNSEAYLTLIIAGGQRYGLDGMPNGEITDGAKTEAARRLAEKRARKNAA